MRHTEECLYVPLYRPCSCKGKGEIVTGTVELERRLFESEELRAAIIAASVAHSELIELLQDRNALLETALEAAKDFLEDASSVNALFALDEAVSAIPTEH